MLLYAFRHHFWLVVAIIAADVVIALTVGDALIRWELRMIEEAWRGE